MVTGQVLGIGAHEVIIVQQCPRCGGPHGPALVPGAPGVGVSWSHARGQVAAIAGHGPVGIDVEMFSADRTEPVHGALTAAEERWMNASPTPALAFLQLWVRKEALVKVGHLTLDTLLTAELVSRNGGLVREWRNYAITGWERESFVGAAAYLKGRRLEAR
jgi:4'-phosphopantetheinyl transferase